MSQRNANLVLAGLGSVGLKFLDHIEEISRRDSSLLPTKLVAIADSSGVAVSPEGFRLHEVVSRKLAGDSVSRMPGYCQGTGLSSVLQDLDCDVFLDATPMDLDSGGVGLQATRAALERGVSVVSANKAPATLAYQQLIDLARKSGAEFRMSATVCGGLPVLNILNRDMPFADNVSIRGVLNATSNFVLENMRRGVSLQDSVTEAQQRGIAEADPSMDVDGWDSACKLAIIASCCRGEQVSLDQISVEGIREIAARDIEEAIAHSQEIRLIAEMRGTALSVKPMQLDNDSFLARCHGWEMGVEIQSAMYGHTYHKIYEREPIPTAASMVRDLAAVLKAAGAE